MTNLPDETINLIFSGLMGIFGGLITIPLNAIVSWLLKHEEQKYQYRLDVIAKKQELLLQHKLEIQRLQYEPKDIEALWKAVKELGEKINHG